MLWNIYWQLALLCGVIEILDRTLLITLLAGTCWNFKTVELIPYLIAARSATIQVESKGSKSIAWIVLEGCGTQHCPHLENCSSSYTNCFGTRWRMPHDQRPERDCPPRHNLSHAPQRVPWMPEYLKNVMVHSPQYMIIKGNLDRTRQNSIYPQLSVSLLPQKFWLSYSQWFIS